MQASPPRLSELLRYFFRLGFLSFGGPVVVAAQLQKDWTEKNNWMSAERFERVLAVIKALPGPTATQLSLFLAYTAQGRFWAAICGILLILPAFSMMLALGFFYPEMQRNSIFPVLLQGMQAGALGVVAAGIFQLAFPILKRKGSKRFLKLLLLAALASYAFPMAEPIVILACGILGALAEKYGGDSETNSQSCCRVTTIPTLLLIFWICFKSGALVFGTGFAVIPTLMADFVGKYQWMSQREFLDGIVFGQGTPGPVVITATFLGFRAAIANGLGVGGAFAGACLATIGIFFAGFFNILTWFPSAEAKMGKSNTAKLFAKWALAGVLGALASTVVHLAPTALALQDASHLQTYLLEALAFLSFGWSAVLTLKWLPKVPNWTVPLAIPLAGLVNILFFLF